MKKLLVLLVSGFLVSASLNSQEKDSVTLTAEITPQAVKKGGKGVFVITCEIAPTYHISDATNELFGIYPEPSRGIQFGEAEYPRGEQDPLESVYRGRVNVKIPFRVEREVSEGKKEISAQVKLQLCAEASGICYPPEARIVKAEFSVLSAQEEVQTSPEEREGLADRLTWALERGSLLAFILVFFGGILTSLTPCVYPMIPITIAVIGAQAAGGKFRGFVLSLFYVFGISITFSTLGVMAAKTGALFGSYVQHPVAVVLIAAVFFTMGLSLLGVFVLQMPSSLASRLQGKRRGGFVGVLLTGLLAGLIVSPCISPLLVVILTWVAKTGSIILGAGLLFSFSLGLGVLFILIGTFSGIIKNLPKSGVWMEVIERGFGILLVVLAIVFLRSVLPALVYHGLWAVFLILFGTFVGAFTPLDREADRRKKAGKAVGVFAILISGCLIFFGLARWVGFGVNPSREVSLPMEEETLWISTDDEGFRQAQFTGKRVLIDFYADWCVACKELDEKTWADETVHSELERFILVRLDLTRNDNQTKVYQRNYKIIGMPTVILFELTGEEVYRFEGFKPPGDVLEILRKN